MMPREETIKKLCIQPLPTRVSHQPGLALCFIFMLYICIYASYIIDQCHQSPTNRILRPQLGMSISISITWMFDADSCQPHSPLYSQFSLLNSLLISQYHMYTHKQQHISIQYISIYSCIADPLNSCISTCTVTLSLTAAAVRVVTRLRHLMFCLHLQNWDSPSPPVVIMQLHIASASNIILIPSKLLAVALHYLAAAAQSIWKIYWILDLIQSASLVSSYKLTACQLIV